MGTFFKAKLPSAALVVVSALLLTVMTAPTTGDWPDGTACMIVGWLLAELRDTNPCAVPVDLFVEIEEEFDPPPPPQPARKTTDNTNKL
jgi:hypothetical protein